MCGRIDWLSLGHRGCFSPDIEPAVYYPSDPEYNEVCFLQGDQVSDDGFKACIRGSDRRNRFDEKWSGKYPKIAKSWKDNWANLSTYFKYSEAVRRLIYTTNAIEGFNRQLRKITKSKTVFP